MPYLIMLAAGIGIPVLAALNSALGRSIGSPAVATAVLFMVALSIAIGVSLATAPEAVTRLSSAPKHLFIAGFFAAFYILSVTWIAPIIGVGNAVFLVLLGQLVSAALIGHFALFGALPAPLTAQRILGLAVMAAGVALTVRA